MAPRKISDKWDLSRIPENWHFTKAHANAVYKKATLESRTRSLPGVPQGWRRMKIGGEWYYFVNGYHANRDRFAFAKDLWNVHGFKVHGTQDGDIYVRRK